MRICLLLLIFSGIGMAQTSPIASYVIPPGAVCITIDGCSYHIPAGSDCVLFETGGYGTQVDFEPACSNPQQALYCGASTIWQVAQMDTGQTQFTMTCSAAGSSPFGPGPFAIRAMIIAHSFVLRFPCGGRIRTICHMTKWVVDEGTLEIAAH